MAFLPSFNLNLDNPPLLNVPSDDKFLHFQVALMKVFVYLTCLEHSDKALLTDVVTTVILTALFYMGGQKAVNFWVVCVWVGIAVFHIGKHHRIMVVSGIVFFLQGFLLEQRFQFIVDCFLVHQLSYYMLRERMIATILFGFISTWRIWEAYLVMYVYFLGCYIMHESSRSTPLQVAYFKMSVGYWVVYFFAKIVGMQYLEMFNRLMTKHTIQPLPELVVEQM